MKRLLVPALVLLCLTLEALFLSLANWQYHRYKATLAEGNSHPAIVTLAGHWVSPTTSVVLDNQPDPRNPDSSGWRLLTAFQPAGTSQTLLVDRGWLPFPNDRLSADLTPFNPAETSATLTGFLKPYPTRKGWVLGPVTTTDPHIFAFLDAPTLQTQVPNLAAQAYLVTAQSTYPLLTALPPPPRDPQRNLSYMLQWWGLAIATPLMFLNLWHKNKKRRSRNPVTR